eukprot:399521-Rhodomonas_salina.1
MVLALRRFVAWLARKAGALATKAVVLTLRRLGVCGYKGDVPLAQEKAEMVLPSLLAPYALLPITLSPPAYHPMPSLLSPYALFLSSYALPAIVLGAVRY